MKLIKVFLVIIALNLLSIRNSFSQNFCIFLNSGFSYRLMTMKDTVSESFQSYFNRKRPGINYNIEAVWYSENQGVGLRFNSFLNSVSGKNIYLSPVENVDKNEDIRITYYSLQYHFRKQIRKSRFRLELCGGIGYVTYHSDGKELAEEILITGNTVGINGTIFLDYRVFKFLSINVSTNLFIAVLSKDLKNGDTEILTNKESLGRFDFNGGVKIGF